MRFLYLLLGLTWCMANSAHAQKSDLVTVLQEIQQNLKPVEDKSTTLSQSLTFNENSPYIITIGIEETDSKGVETTEYQLNLAYLNERQVKWESDRKQMNVSIYSKDKFIQVTKNGEQENYEDDLAIPCPDIDNARTIEELLRKTIPFAQTAWENDSQLPSEFSGLKKYVIDAVKDVQEGSEMYVQKLEPQSSESSRFTFSKRYISDKGEEQDRAYVFNFTDIHPPSIATMVKGKSVYVELKTDNREKFIEVTEESEVDYTDEVQIQTSSFEDAQLLTIALRRFVPEARLNQKEILPTLASNEAALSYLNDAIHTYTFNGTDITQTVNGKCLFELEQESSNDKTTTAKRVLADLSDLAPSSIEIDVSSKGIWVVAKTKEQSKYVMLYEDGVQQNYDGSFQIGAADIPNAKAIRYGLTEAINTCKGEVNPSDLSWMTNLINDNNDPQTDIEQRLETFEDNTCKLALTVLESGKRETTEDRYEFNLFDLDKNTVTLVTKGTQAMVQAGTIYKERVVNLYKNDGSLDYENVVTVIVPDIQSGKIFMETLKSLIEKCEK